MDKLDLDIIISLKVDSDDRINNLDIVMNYLQNNLRCNIIISEQDTFPKLKDRYDCDYVFTEVDEFFNRQRGLNIGVTKSNAKVIAHYDADIIINIKQLLKSYQLINSDNYDMIYPYDGRFLDVPKEYHDMIDKLELIPTDKCNLFNSNSVGGVVFFNRQVFLNGGGANENFKGLGYEDNEIFERFTKLGYNYARVEGLLYHLNHIRTDTAYDNNPYVNQNAEEYNRIASMNKQQLENEIKTWNF